MNLSDLRQNYTKGSFSEGDLIGSPFDQFRKWFRAVGREDEENRRTKERRGRAKASD